MDREKINKEITEKVFEECWHERPGKDATIRHCTKCGITIYTTIDGMIVDLKSNPDYFTLEGCMKLFLEVGKVGPFWEFARKRMAVTNTPGGEFFPYYHYDFINPDKLAPAVYDFIKGRTKDTFQHSKGG